MEDGMATDRIELLRHDFLPENVSGPMSYNLSFGCHSAREAPTSIDWRSPTLQDSIVLT